MRLSRGLSLCVAVIAFTLLAWRTAANDLEIPSDAPAMVEHAAIVQQMIDTCGRTRPDLLGSLRQANADWWQRNAGVAATMEKLLNNRESSSKANGLLANYAAVYHRLDDESKDFSGAGHSCESLLDNLARGKLDYSEPAHAGDDGSSWGSK